MDGAGRPEETADDLRVERRPDEPALVVIQPARSARFNGWLEAKDPVEFLGTPLAGFRQNFTIPLNAESVRDAASLREALYGDVQQKVRLGRLGSTEQAAIDYQDSTHPKDSRRYVRLTCETLRSTRITTLFRCYIYGDANLYFALDSFVLPRLATSKVVLRAAVTLALLLIILRLPGPLSVLGLLTLALVGWAVWGRVARAVRSEGLAHGLRAVYPSSLAESSFDLDDTLMHLKSTLPAIMSSLAVVGPKYGLDTRSLEQMLEEMIQSVRKGTSITVNNSGSMSGLNIGGIGNTTSGGKV